MTAKRNGEVDFLRFVFAIQIVFYHFNSNYPRGFFVNGYIGVEFFFVVSGFLMAKHVEKKGTEHADLGAIADETWNYVINKVKSFYMYYVSVIILQVVVQNILIKHERLMSIAYSFLSSIPTFTLSFMALNRNDVYLYVGNTWFLSALLISILILYPILLRNYKYATKIVFPMISLFVLGYQYATNVSISVSKNWAGHVYYGVLRALAEMSLGGSLCALSSLLTKKWKELNTNRKRIQILATLLKVFCYLVVIAFSYGNVFGRTFRPGFNLHALLFCSAGILLSFSNIGYCIPDCKTTRYLGKISLPIFIYHGFIRWTVLALVDSASTEVFASLIIMSIVVSVGLMYMTDYVMLVLKKFIKKII